jgi:fructose-bisphosphate aldolase class II
MPVATAEHHAAMLDTAAGGGYALPAVNVTSSETLNGALRGFAEAGADGIVQVTTGGAAFLSGDARRRPTMRWMTSGSGAEPPAATRRTDSVNSPRSPTRSLSR